MGLKCSVLTANVVQSFLEVSAFSQAGILLTHDVHFCL
jgi:hypothetical protein